MNARIQCGSEHGAFRKYDEDVLDDRESNMWSITHRQDEVTT